MPHRPGIGAIFGIVSEDGVAAQKRVILMDRSNMTVVARTISDENGGYVFSGLNTETDDYLVFAVDDDGSPPKEALIRDYIQPIPAHQGATFPANWFKLALASDAFAAWMGQVDINGDPITSIGAPAVLTPGTSVTFSQAPITPGAPMIASTLLNNASIGVAAKIDPARMSGNTVGSAENPLKVSLEFVFRRSSVSGTAGVALISGAARSSGGVWSLNVGSTGYARCLARIIYTASTQTLIANNNSHVGTGDTNLWANLRDLFGSVDISSFPDDIHVVLTCEYGNQATLYVNGEVVASASLAGQNSFVRVTSNAEVTFPSGVVTCSTTDNVANVPSGSYSTFLCGPIAGYFMKVLSAEEVEAHYQALMVGTAPLETGYAKEVVVDLPALYYRLNEPDSDDGFQDWLTSQRWNNRAMTIFNPSGITFSEESPVTGQTGVVFAGGSAARTNFSPASDSSSRRELSFEFFAGPSRATPPANEYILTLTDTGEVIYAGVWRNTSGQYVLRVRESSAAVTYTFNTIIPHDEIHHIVITLDKSVSEARLYVDGELEETLPTTPSLIDQWNGTSADHFRQAMIGGVVNDAFDSASNTYVGFLAEVAFYPKALSPSRVMAHYEARNVV